MLFAVALNLAAFNNSVCVANNGHDHNQTYTETQQCFAFAVTFADTALHVCVRTFASADTALHRPFSSL